MRLFYAALIGEWAEVGQGTNMILKNNNDFEMAHLRGQYTADGGKIVLHLPSGRETFRYQVQDRTLSLFNSNLSEPQIFKRVALLATKKPSIPTTKAKTIKRMQLYGKWRVVDQALSEPLTLFLSPTGTMAFGPMHGRWKYEHFRLTLTSVNGTERVYHLSLDGTRMRMSGGDLEDEIILVRAK